MIVVIRGAYCNYFDSGDGEPTVVSDSSDGGVYCSHCYGGDKGSLL